MLNIKNRCYTIEGLNQSVSGYCENARLYCDFYLTCCRYICRVCMDINQFYFTDKI